MKLLRKMLYITARLGDGCANDGKAVPGGQAGGSILLCIENCLSSCKESPSSFILLNTVATLPPLHEARNRGFWE